MPRRLASLLLATTVIGGAALAGCSRTEGAMPAPTCAEMVADASVAIETADQLRLLDAALLACRSLEAFRAELAAHPGIVGYSLDQYIELRCDKVADAALRDSPTCRASNPPTTPPATAPEAVYAAETLDGRVVELRPSDAVPFTDGVPAVVKETVDIAMSQGCEGIVAQRDKWAVQAAAGTPGGDGVLSAADIASAYAKHAQNVLVFVGCPDLAPIPG